MGPEIRLGALGRVHKKTVDVKHPLHAISANVLGPWQVIHRLRVDPTLRLDIVLS